jgi:hypothetical protein
MADHRIRGADAVTKLLLNSVEEEQKAYVTLGQLFDQLPTQPGAPPNSHAMNADQALAIAQVHATLAINSSIQALVKALQP